MIEVFQLSDTDFQASIDEVLAARSDKAPCTTGPVTHSGAVAKATAPTKLSNSARESIREALFPASPAQASEAPTVPDVDMSPSVPV